MHTLTVPVVDGIQKWLRYAAQDLAMDSSGSVLRGPFEDDEELYRPYYSVVPVGSSLEPTGNSSSYLSVAHSGVSHNSNFDRPDKLHTINFVIQARSQAISTSDRDFVKVAVDWGLNDNGMHFGIYNYSGTYRIQPEPPVYFDKSTTTYIARLSMRFLLC
jgi:hypothetical protein